MKRIFKYPLSLCSPSLKLPFGAEVLSVQVQHDVPCLWALVDDEALVFVERDIRCYGTGHHVGVANEPHRFLGTIQLEGGDLVLHFFEAL